MRHTHPIKGRLYWKTTPSLNDLKFSSSHVMLYIKSQKFGLRPAVLKKRLDDRPYWSTTLVTSQIVQNKKTLYLLYLSTIQLKKMLVLKSQQCFSITCNPTRWNDQPYWITSPLQMHRMWYKITIKNTHYYVYLNNTFLY